MKGENEEMYYTIIINMWFYLSTILIESMSQMIVNESNLARIKLVLLSWDIIQHLFAIYFLFVVFGATGSGGK